MNKGDVMQILVGPYKGGNGLLLEIRKNKVLLVVDPFGKKIWFNKKDVR